MNRAVLLAALMTAMAFSATARERGFRPTAAATMGSGGESTLCTFKSPQVSGYRARASERRICYYECGDRPTAIVIRSTMLCSGEQTILVWNSDASASFIERRPRGNGPLGVAVVLPGE